MNCIIKKLFCCALSCILILTLLSGCSLEARKQAEKTGSSSSQTIEAIYPVQADVNFHTKKQEAFLSKSRSNTIFYATGKSEKSKPEAIEFEWDYHGDSTENDFVIHISENENMSKPITYTSSSNSVCVYNLKIATTYYWTVSTDSESSSICTFTTSGTAPRNINVDGITNVRDLGGWMTESNTRTKQGLIYRCGRLNESSAENVNIEITDNGIKTMCDDLGIKSEIDLRKLDGGETGGITSSPLGDDVNYFNCPMGWEGNMFLDNKEEILHVFDILSKEENYPIIFHCNIGTDRTGMIAFIINALLGVPEEDLYRDYLFSNFGNIGGRRVIKTLKESGYCKAIQNAEGKTLSEKTYNCLVDFGVSDKSIDKIIEILS